MDALLISPKNTMQKVVPVECENFAVEDTLLYCMVWKFKNIRKKETMKTLIATKTNQKK